MNKTITFGYTYREGANDAEKYDIDAILAANVAKAFWKLHREGHITDFYLIDEDMTPSTGEKDDEDTL